MGKTAFLFPGQGIQRVGLDRDLYDRYPIVRDTFKEADDWLGFSLSNLCFEGSEDKLNQTRFAQLAIYTLGVAHFRVYQEQGYNASNSMLAGHSLGEWSAICSAGSVNFRSGLEAVQVRAWLMDKACHKHPGSMRAILGLGLEQVESICQEISSTGSLVVVANQNCPGQAVISGTIEGVQKASFLLEAKGARTRLLNTAGAFHSPLMSEAAERFRTLLSSVFFCFPKIPLYSNTTGKMVQNALRLYRLMADQIKSPVLWQKEIEQMIDDGATEFIELCGTTVLTGMVNRIIKAKN